MPSVTVSCHGCGAELVRWASAVANSKTGQFYCSRDCLHNDPTAYKRSAWFTCEHCECLYSPSLAGTRSKRFCSTDCREGYRQEHGRVYQARADKGVQRSAW